MAIYLLLTNLTEEGRKTIEDFPERIKELLGQYDFVNIVEAPSDEIAAKLSIHLSAKAELRTLTLPAIPLDNLVATLKKKQTPL
jgi:uncharacterized protein with GYD domain